jgi:hypothetical protein
MPTNKPPKQVSLVQISVTDPEPEDYETALRFKQFALTHKNYIKALKRLMDLANVA